MSRKCYVIYTMILLGETITSTDMMTVKYKSVIYDKCNLQDITPFVSNNHDRLRNGNKSIKIT